MIMKCDSVTFTVQSEKLVQKGVLLISLMVTSQMQALKLLTLVRWLLRGF